MQRRAVVSRGAALLAVVAVCVAGSVSVPATASPVTPSSAASSSTGMSIGSWNVNLTPFLGGQQDVVDQVATSGFDVLALQGVWSQGAEDALLADPRIAAHYPYHYSAPAVQEPGSIPYTPDVVVADRARTGRSSTTRDGVQPQVTRDALDDYIGCLLSTGTDTRTVITPASPIDGFCFFLGLNIALESQPGFATLVATMQTLADGDDAYRAADLGFNGQGVKFAYDGRPGQLILSTQPIQDVEVTTLEPYLIRRSTVAATIGGLRIGFADWPTNYFYDVDPSLGPLQQGALQPDYAQAAIGATPPLDVLVGSFNSGPDYQPDAYNLLVGNGFTPSSHAETYCPSGQTGFSRCAANNGDQAPEAVDNVFAGPHARCVHADTFATTQLSEHIGVSATCGGEVTVTGVSPATGPTTGGQTVVLTGTGFTGAIRVRFAPGSPAQSFTVDSDTQITAVTPAHSAGVFHARVVRGFGHSARSAANRYSFVSPS